MTAPGYQDSLRFLYERINYERISTTPARYPFRLRRMAELAERIGLGDHVHVNSPNPPIPLVHIAGTKGKGSTAAMVAGILSKAGYRTGLYTSPHLNDLEERFRIDHVPCSANEIVSLVDRIRSVVEEMDREAGSGPTFFELTTAMAMLHFQSQACDAIILEVGLGGRLDSTNVFSSSVTAITSIGLDHQHVLGNTIAEIAAEKAGIIKPNVSVVSSVARPEAIEVIRKTAADRNAPLYQLGETVNPDGEPASVTTSSTGDFVISIEPNCDWGSKLCYQGRTAPLCNSHEMTLAMEGDHQARNAAVAIAVADLLAGSGLSIPETAFASGLASLNCTARIERFHLSDDVIAIVDAAHNEDSVAALIKTINDRLPDRQITIVFGTSRDKSAEPMLAALAPMATHLVLTKYSGNPRYREPAEMLAMVPNADRPETNRPDGVPHLRTHVIADAIDACQRGRELASPGGALVICGSFFLAAEARQWILGLQRLGTD
ncbi:folylpolyglutamate synthase/dihydrofolate synthase [Rhodopirellula maiorica SM1]|uniref:Dihydrofolate synthase/folylpolyglutamate synthase n=1 Tax=Rhodopirellula maiorica SM1 TaxID=1265738 RepID=M5RDQ4_9BACT|nr:folylpolyglutamate synthase/dihydrofolate synthase family protein [Rhodopirellula maiorica]EMI17201.1 folylpolyglutamate synthase/dihydrofolate synthase [Rhodopirellula maiorica SM1]